MSLYPFLISLRIVFRTMGHKRGIYLILFRVKKRGQYIQCAIINEYSIGNKTGSYQIPDGLTFDADGNFRLGKVSSGNVVYVINNDFRGAYLAANYLLGQGKNSIFFLSGPERISVATSRTQGLQTAFREKNLPFLKSRILYDNLTFKDGYQALGRILRVQRPPFGIFCSSDIVAIGALSAARDSGYKIPEEISIVGYDNIANDQYLDYPLTTIAQADYQIGSHGMKVLVEMITSKEPYHQVNQIMFEPELIIRKT